MAMRARRPARSSRSAGLARVAGGLEDDRAGDEDRGGVGEEEDEGAEREAELGRRPSVMPTTASTGTSEMAIATPARMSATSRRASANEPATPMATATPRSRIVGAVRPDDLRVHVDRHAVDGHQPDEHADEDVHGDAADQQQQRAAQGAAVADHGRQRQPVDGRAQRRDDHRADHRRRGVADHAAGGDDARQHQLHPELGRLGARRADVEEDVVLDVDQRLVVLPAGSRPPAPASPHALRRLVR